MPKTRKLVKKKKILKRKKIAKKNNKSKKLNKKRNMIGGESSYINEELSKLNNKFIERIVINDKYIDSLNILYNALFYDGVNPTFMDDTTMEKNIEGIKSRISSRITNQIFNKYNFNYYTNKMKIKYTTDYADKILNDDEQLKKFILNVVNNKVFKYLRFKKHNFEPDFITFKSKKEIETDKEKKLIDKSKINEISEINKTQESNPEINKTQESNAEINKTQELNTEINKTQELNTEIAVQKKLCIIS